ncbi:MAG: hypothetical protein PPP58_11820 [Natronomonas sp.]
MDTPIEGQIVLLAGAKASVTVERLFELVADAQETIRERRERYERRYERIEGTDNRVYYLVERDHWKGLCADLDLGERECDSLQRAHAEQFRRDGRRLDRAEEFESALDLRAVVAVDDD